MKKSMYEYKEPPSMGELTDTLHINVDEIPDHVRDELAAATLDFVIRLKKEGLLPKNDGSK